MMNVFDESFTHFIQNSGKSLSEQDFQKKSFQKFKEIGFPSRKIENWKYTSLKNLTEKPWQLALEKSQAPGLSQKSLDILNAQIIKDTYSLVFINGQFSLSLSNLADLESKYHIQWSENNQWDFSDITENQKKSGLEVFNFLQKSFVQAAVKFRIPKNVSIDRPVVFIFASVGEAGTRTFNQKFVDISVDQFSKVSIIEKNVSLDDQEIFENKYFQIQLADSASLEYLKIQNTNLASMHLSQNVFRLNANSTLRNLNLSLGGILARNHLEVLIQGAGATAEILGSYVGEKSQQHDSYTNIEHLVGGSTTTQLYKGLLDGQAKSVFSGRVFIDKKAIKASSDQLNNNLLLSRGAEANSKPQLEIYADDVKATHGSTVGQIREDELFYLNSRAISKSKAMELLSYGFVAEVVEKLENNKLREEAQKALSEKFSHLDSVVNHALMAAENSKGKVKGHND